MKIKLSVGNKELLSTFPGSKQVTVGRVLLSLESSHPNIYEKLYDEKGRLKPSLTVLVNGENIRYRN